MPDDPHVPRSGRRRPLRCATQLHANRDLVAQLGAVAATACAPRAVVTCARGSSDHAATFAKYLIETRLGVLTSSAAPSVSSVYARSADLDGVLFIAISQSGASPDLLAPRRSGAGRRRARDRARQRRGRRRSRARAHHAVPLRAGAETSVAATKSYIASLAAIVHLVAELDAAMRARCRRSASAPAQLASAWQLDWSAAIERAARARAICSWSAAASGSASRRRRRSSSRRPAGCTPRRSAPPKCSTARWRSSSRGFPVLALAQDDETRDRVSRRWPPSWRGRGADVMLAGSARSRARAALPTQRADPAIEPLLMIQSFYRARRTRSRVARGLDPDRPPHLQQGHGDV